MIKQRRRSSTVAALAVVAATALSACGSASNSAQPDSDIDATGDTVMTVVTVAPSTTPTTAPFPSRPEHDAAGGLPISSPDRVVDAVDGAVARDRVRQLGGLGDASASTSFINDCGVSGGPSDEVIASANADTQGLVDAFVRFGIDHATVVDAVGWLIVDYDGLDAVAQSVADSYWNARFPGEYNDGPEFVEDPIGLPVLDIEAPTDEPVEVVALAEPSTDDIVRQASENRRLSDAFEAAGIEYELVADELGWEWIEWNFDDPELFDAVNTVFIELYSPAPSNQIDPVESCIVVDTFGGDEGIGDGRPLPTESERREVTEVDEAKPVDEIPVETPVDDFAEREPFIDADEASRVAQRDTDITALVDGFLAAAVTFDVVGESPWNTVLFDIADDAAIAVVAAVIAAR